MGRINRRIYATRRKRSPNKMFAPGGMTPTGKFPGGNNESFRKGAGPQDVPFQEDKEGIGGGKTYTITEVQSEENI